MISITPSSTFLTYVVIFQLHLHMVYIAAYLICKRLLDIRSVFGSRQSTDKQVDVTGVSTVLFTDSFPQRMRAYKAGQIPRSETQDI
jgi:hypothetical protein